MKLEGKSAIVTGASRGLGKAIARRLLEDGAHVVLAARDRGALAQTADELTQCKPLPSQRVLYEAGEISNAAHAQRLVNLCESAFGTVDVMVCNAGVYGPLGRLEETEWPEWQRAVEINLFGVVHCCRAALPVMRRQGHGKIIALSGGGATKALPRFSAYAASKTAVVRLVETLAEEVSDAGIDVNAIAPGALNTRLLDEVLAAGPEGVGASFYERSLEQQRSGGTSLETGAALVSFLASPESDGITGRLLAAVWDDWEHLPEQRHLLAGSDVFTLRRIVPGDRDWPQT